MMFPVMQPSLSRDTANSAAAAPNSVKFPGLHQRCGNGAVFVLRLPAEEALRIDEEESLVLDNRAAESAAELILAEVSNAERRRNC